VGTTAIVLMIGTTVVCDTGVFSDSGQLGRPLAQPTTVITMVEEAPEVSGPTGTTVVPTEIKVVVGWGPWSELGQCFWPLEHPTTVTVPVDQTVEMYEPGGGTTAVVV